MPRDTKLTAAGAELRERSTRQITVTPAEALKTMSVKERAAVAREIAAREGIKYKSAMRRFQRAEKDITENRGKVRGLSEKTVTAMKESLPEKFAIKEKIEYRPTTVEMKATYDFYGNDRRRRSVNFYLDGGEARAFAEAKTRDDAIGVLLRSAPNSMEDCEVKNIEWLKIKDWHGSK